MHWYRDKRDHMLKEAEGVEGEYPVLQHLSLKIVVFSKISTGVLVLRGHRPP